MRMRWTIGVYVRQQLQQIIVTIVVTNYVMCVRWTNCCHSCWTIVTNEATA